MYKPQTIEQYKVHRFLKKNFALEHFLLSPLSRSGLILEDKAGEQIAFAFQNGSVSEVAVPTPATREEADAFFEKFSKLNPRPVLNDFEKLTRWWLEHPNPFTYQQALGMPDDLYRHFLSHPLINEDKVLALALKGLVTEEDYMDLTLWYLYGHTSSCWLGPLGLDGTGSIYGLTLGYRTPKARELQFYLLDDYYRIMNGLAE